MANENDIMEMEETTTWVNDLDVEVSFTLCLENGKRKKFVLPPGKKIKLPSVYDRAIRKTNKRGQVIGGRAPTLRKDGEKEVKLVPALDFKAAADEAELQALALKIEKDEALKKAIEKKAERDADKLAKKGK